MNGLIEIRSNDNTLSTSFTITNDTDNERSIYLERMNIQTNLQNIDNTNNTCSWLERRQLYTFGDLKKYYNLSLLYPIGTVLNEPFTTDALNY